jgi:hypothetical protein
MQRISIAHTIAHLEGQMAGIRMRVEQEVHKEVVEKEVVEKEVVEKEVVEKEVVVIRQKLWLTD